MKALDGLLIIKPIDKFPNDFFKQILTLRKHILHNFIQFKQINLYHTTKETTADVL